jgi:hypothetical protein
MDDLFWEEPHSIAMDAVRECPPYGIYLLQAVLRKAGHDAIVADLIAAGSNSMVPYLSDLTDCRLVGIAATSIPADPLPGRRFLFQAIVLSGQPERSMGARSFAHSYWEPKKPIG